jgi:predicted TIM-barrel fold metal-dependent hydrolase
MIQLTSIVLNGVLGRFPDLRLASMEAGAGWVPFMLERLDRETKNRGAGLRSLPSDQLRSDRVFFHCELDERLLPVAVDALGAGHFFCASDFPHEPIHEFMEAVEGFGARRDLADAAKTRILYNNPKRLYRLDAARPPRLPWRDTATRLGPCPSRSSGERGRERFRTGRGPFRTCV